MKKTKVKVPAKINLTLDVLGKNDGYHTLESLVCSINLYDLITVSKRKDYSTRLICKGLDVGCANTQNNAYIAAERFRKQFDLGGVDIVVKKNIPVGGGLGGSSADIAGVLKGCKKLFNLDCDLTEIANNLGSDSAYMLNGGYAVMQGRGDIVKPLNIKTKLYFLIVSMTESVSARDCYSRFDSDGITYPKSTSPAVEKLANQDIKGFTSVIKNDLYKPAKEILPEIEENVKNLKAVYNGFMTGSGSATFAVFSSKKLRNKAYKILLPRYGKKLIKAQTV